ncbi:sensor histidine kinase [Thauera humireducens]|uniref:sensor histidine kinase n=1 Tax=Thauera humireducens TaxID=1134435 RepID=UPI003C70BCE9
MYGDADLLGIALRNLIDNAIRYTPAGSSIVIRVEDEEGGRVCLCVRDDGPGVPDELIARLGERFVRGRDTLAEGSGLGLAIVSRIMQLHGGGSRPGTSRRRVRRVPVRSRQSRAGMKKPGTWPGLLKGIAFCLSAGRRGGSCPRSSWATTASRCSASRS